MVQGCTSIVGKSDKEGKKGERKKGGRQCKNFTPAQTKKRGKGDVGKGSDWKCQSSRKQAG